MLVYWYLWLNMAADDDVMAMTNGWLTGWPCALTLLYAGSSMLVVVMFYIYALYVCMYMYVGWYEHVCGLAVYVVCLSSTRPRG